MKVFYRIYPGKPDNRPFANGDKRTLMRTCLCSFVRSCRHAKADIQLTILLDGCPDEWVDIVLYAALGMELNIVRLNGVGNKPSFLKQIDMALDGPSNEFVYFAEDDYLYRKKAVSEMLSFARTGCDDLMTLYDHPDRYRRGDDHHIKDHIEICDDWHWRTAESTTMTFGAWKDTVCKVFDVIQENACMGRAMWHPILSRQGFFLWSPIPSLATHVQDGVLAPCVDWEKVWKHVAS